MILLAIILLVLEAGRDSRKGDPHDLNSNLRIVRDALTVSAYGLAFGLVVGAPVYLVVRFCIFDYLYNLFALRRWDYLGDTSRTDRALQKINPFLLLSLRALLILALILLL